MRPSNVAYPNLRAEMSRKNIGVLDIARALGQNRDTISRKLSNRTKISLDEAFDIQQKFFPEFDLLYLFDPSPLGGVRWSENKKTPFGG